MNMNVRVGWDILQIWKVRICYFIKSKKKKGHGNHFPIVFEFVNSVLSDNSKYDEYETVKSLVQSLKTDSKIVDIEELGGGSRFFKSGARRVKDLVAKSSVEQKFGRLLFRIIRHYKPETVVELGTSLGISSIYMAIANETTILHTIEGNVDVSNLAQRNAESIGIKNIVFHHGFFADLLPDLAKQLKPKSVAFVDGNHTYDATMEYYRLLKDALQTGIIIFDDIYWSSGMRRAWKEIVAAEIASLDLYQFGIVFIGDS